MKKIKVKVRLVHKLEGLNRLVVQASLLEDDQAFALQLLHGQRDITVFKADKSGQKIHFDLLRPVLELTNSAGGHTQTWVSAGKENLYFIGTSPKKYGPHYWDTEFARIDLNSSKRLFHDKGELIRLTHLGNPNRILKRAECTVTPDKSKLLIASIAKDHVGHFALYDLKKINDTLDNAEDNYVDLRDISPIKCFEIEHFDQQPLRSIQGYAIDNDLNIYVSSQSAPKKNKFRWGKAGKPRMIVKIPWGLKNSANWQAMTFTKKIDLPFFVTEFEGLQLCANHRLLLTVAYHRRYDLKTTKNRIYEIIPK